MHRVSCFFRYMLNAMFNLNISGAVLDRLVDLIDYDGNDSVSFAEFCRVFTSMDILSVRQLVSILRPLGCPILAALAACTDFYPRGRRIETALRSRATKPVG